MSLDDMNSGEGADLFSDLDDAWGIPDTIETEKEAVEEGVLTRINRAVEKAQARAETAEEMLAETQVKLAAAEAKLASGDFFETLVERVPGDLDAETNDLVDEIIIDAEAEVNETIAATDKLLEEAAEARANSAERTLSHLQRDLDSLQIENERLRASNSQLEYDRGLLLGVKPLPLNNFIEQLRSMAAPIKYANLSVSTGLGDLNNEEIGMNLPQMERVLGNILDNCISEPEVKLFAVDHPTRGKCFLIQISQDGYEFDANRLSDTKRICELYGGSVGIKGSSVKIVFPFHESPPDLQVSPSATLAPIKSIQEKMRKSATSGSSLDALNRLAEELKAIKPEALAKDLENPNPPIPARTED